MNKLIFFSLFLLFCAKVTAQDKITIQSGKSYPENQQGISEFYFVHQTFADAFYMTDLYKQLSDDQMFNILNKVYHSVTANNKVLAIIEQDKGPAARLGFQIFKNTEIGDILVLGTNFNSKKRIFEKEVDPNQSIYRWYAIKKNKLVYRKDLYSKEAEEKARNENAYSLIDMYLFDDNFENDKQVKHLIDELLSNTNDEVDKLYAYC
ncbi:hypothetical protein [Salegentibacter chungangensis]|uniref:TPM domain-containing protein n=1 Tax=Salegentibacter chungangensis TaxID=1335724 RepID=A0ABW3NTH1_9FLAO